MPPPTVTMRAFPVAFARAVAASSAFCVRGSSLTPGAATHRFVVGSYW